MTASQELNDTLYDEVGVELHEVLDYLDKLRESGITNMYGAGQYIQEMFDVDRSFASTLLGHWMETFSERHSD